MSSIYDPKNRLPDGIPLATAKGREIPNSQAGEIAPLQVKTLENLIAKYNAELRCTSTVRYNCHGLTFANRRTGIDDDTIIPSILKDDGYVQVSPEEAMPGDVVLYWNETNGDIEHSGILVEPRNPNDPLKPARILSKWSKGPEALHNANNCPYDPASIRYYRIQQIDS